MNILFIEEILDLNGFLLGQINDRQKEFLTARGYPQQLNEAWYQALRDIGGTGALPDMFYQALLGQIDINLIGSNNRFLTSLGEPVITFDGNNLLV